MLPTAQVASSCSQPSDLIVVTEPACSGGGRLQTST